MMTAMRSRTHKPPNTRRAASKMRSAILLQPAMPTLTVQRRTLAFALPLSRHWTQTQASRIGMPATHPKLGHQLRLLVATACGSQLLRHPQIQRAQRSSLLLV